RTTDILHQLTDGNFDDFRNNTSSIIIGSRLAELLQAGVGDTVQLLAPNGEYWRFTVASVARAGIGSIDSTRVYSHARVAQALLQQPSGASMIIYKLRNPNRAPALASRFETLFQHNASSWQEREESTLQLFLTLRMSVAITVSLIILLAGFGIFNVLTMSVLAKTKEIAILRSMGYRRIDISAIFLWQGAAIAAAGSLLGCALGALMTWGVSHIPIRLRGLLYTNYFLVTWDWRHYVFATLLDILGLLDLPDGGRVSIESEPVAQLNDDELAYKRSKLIGFIFQFHFLMEDFTAQENVMIPMRKLGQLSDAKMRERAADLLESVGLGDKLRRSSRHLSGGEQQRVAIARALANDPKVILADEPTGNLDTANSERAFELLQNLVHERGKALLLATHNPVIAEA